MSEIERRADALWAFLTVWFARYAIAERHGRTRYMGRHRAPSLWQQWTTAAQAATTEVQEARALTPVEWWEERRRDYAPAYARTQAGAYA